MSKTHWIVLSLLLLLAYAGSSRAQAVFVPAASRSDMVYDAARDRIYIANGDHVVRWAVAAQQFLSPIPLGAGASARGMDLSPDGSKLAVADLTGTSTGVRVHIVDLNTLAVMPRTTPRAYMEGGTWSVAFASDGTLLVTSTFQGSGWVPMRRLLVNAGRWSTVATVSQNTMLSASGDRKTIAFAEGNISDGRWGLFDVPTQRVVRRQWYAQGTGWFNFEIATDAVGSQFAIPTYNGAYIYDADYARLAILGTYAGPQPTGVAYHPVENLVYFPWAETSTVQVFDTQTRERVDTLEIGNTFGHTGNWAYGNGRTRISADGSLLMVSVPNGMRYLRMYAPLTAYPAAAVATSGSATAIPLAGSIGNGGTLRYTIARQPLHGAVTISGDTATYRSAPGYQGLDTFNYTVRYGATATAAATVTVNNVTP